MHLLKILVFTTSAIALPTIPSFNTTERFHVPSPDQEICAHCMSCYGKQIGWGQQLEYTVHVGEPFNNASGCNYVEQKIKDKAIGFQDDGWSCESDKAGDNPNTVLKFVLGSHGFGKQVNEGLTDAYNGTEVVKANPFNCPSH